VLLCTTVNWNRVTFKALQFIYVVDKLTVCVSLSIAKTILQTFHGHIIVYKATVCFDASFERVYLYIHSKMYKNYISSYVSYITLTPLMFLKLIFNDCGRCVLTIITVQIRLMRSCFLIPVIKHKTILR